MEWTLNLFPFVLFPKVFLSFRLKLMFFCPHWPCRLSWFLRLQFIFWKIQVYTWLSSSIFFTSSFHFSVIVYLFKERTSLHCQLDRWAISHRVDIALYLVQWFALDKQVSFPIFTFQPNIPCHLFFVCLCVRVVVFDPSISD